MWALAGAALSVMGGSVVGVLVRHLRTGDRHEVRAKSVILATGASLKTLDVPGEEEFKGRGVSHCASCDAPLLRGAPAVVVGGGDSALQEALVLAQYCKDVRLVHRANAVTGATHLQELVNAQAKILKTFNAEVTAVKGGQMVEGVSLKHADGRTEDLACAGLFAYVGLEPNADYLPAAIQRDAKGFVVTNDKLETAVPGVWAAGAVRAGCGGLLDDAIADAKKVAAGVRAQLG